MEICISSYCKECDAWYVNPKFCPMHSMVQKFYEVESRIEPMCAIEGIS